MEVHQPYLFPSLENLQKSSLSGCLWKSQKLLSFFLQRCYQGITSNPPNPAQYYGSKVCLKKPSYFNKLFPLDLYTIYEVDNLKNWPTKCYQFIAKSQVALYGLLPPLKIDINSPKLPKFREKRNRSFYFPKLKLHCKMMIRKKIAFISSEPLRIPSTYIRIYTDGTYKNMKYNKSQVGFIFKFNIEKIY